MRFGRQAHREAITVSFETAFISWLPIALGIILGTVMRLAVFLFGGRQTPAAVGSILGAGLGAMLAILWLYCEEENSHWWVLLKVSVAWVVLSAAFRAMWIGLIIGSGWTGVTGDYDVRDGQPWAIVLGLIAAAPLALKLSRRRSK